MAPLPPAEDRQGTPHGVKASANFTDPLSMLGACAALLYLWGLPVPGQSGHFAQPSGHRPRRRENPRAQSHA